MGQNGLFTRISILIIKKTRSIDAPGFCVKGYQFITGLFEVDHPEYTYDEGIPFVIIAW